MILKEKKETILLIFLNLFTIILLTIKFILDKFLFHCKQSNIILKKLKIINLLLINFKR